MPPAQHALLGASKAHQWLNCTPSVRWEQSFPEVLGSDAAAEGTLAHAIAEEHLNRILAGKKVATSARLKKDPLYKPAMEEYVATYTTYVMEVYNKALMTTPDAMLKTEQRIDFSKWVPDGFGTADAVLIADNTMHVFDLKYGKGVPVDAVGNPQLRLYALGAYEEFCLLYDIETITMHIVQPRLDSITSETLSVGALQNWALSVVRPAAVLAIKGEGEFKAGEHCRWCRCKNKCRAFAEKQMEIARLRFNAYDEERVPNELTMGEIAEILDSVDGLTRWAKSIKDWALDQAVNHNNVIPGWKLVEGRSNRAITDESAAIEKLDTAGFTVDQITELKGITSLEELVGKKQLAEILGDLMVKPAGKPVLAREDDRRPAINGVAEAQAVFTPIED